MSAGFRTASLLHDRWCLYRIERRLRLPGPRGRKESDMRCVVPFALLGTLATVGCTSSTASTAATSPTAVTTETFNGTVNVGGSDFHTFTSTQSGDVNVTLNAASPPSTIFMGVGIGTPSASTCALLSGGTADTQAGTTSQLSGTLDAGTYCVEVFDVGNETAPVSYTVTVAHP